jgi:hypothetical protein
MDADRVIIVGGGPIGMAPRFRSIIVRSRRPTT